MRIDKTGRDVTDLPGLWDDGDYEIVATNYPHPDIKSGMHMNGPSQIWVRIAEVGEWICTQDDSMRRVMQMLAKIGIAEFVAIHGSET